MPDRADASAPRPAPPFAAVRAAVAFVRIALVVLPPALALPTRAVAQESAAPGEVAGCVLDERGVPVEGATVTLVDADREAVTDASGCFEMGAVPAGRRRIAVRRLGFEAPELEIVVPPGDRLQVEVRLRTDPVPVATITVLDRRSLAPALPLRLREVPGAVAYVDRTEIDATRAANLHDVLRLVPGVWVQPRFGAADKLQLSIRGSGLRSAFELRGVNILLDGMPVRAADGFADVEPFELLATRAVRVYPAGNALRLGGATLGGAIDLELETGRTAPTVQAFAEGGSWGFFKGHAAAGVATENADLYVGYARTDLDGYRVHSANRRDRVTLNAGWSIAPRVLLRGFYSFAAVSEERPGSLTAEQLAENPRQANPGSAIRDAGRSYTFHHVGARLRVGLGPGSFLEATPFLQVRPLEVKAFRVVEQDNRDAGLELRFETRGALGGRPSRLEVGVQGATGKSDHRQFENLGGERGEVRRDQRDEAASLAAFAEASFTLGKGLSAVLGLRYDRSRRAIEDALLADGDQSDSQWTDALQPRLGLVLDVPAAGLQLFGNASRLYEPPLLVDLNATVGPGFLDLRPQTAWQYELGARGEAGGLAWSISAWDLELRDEILNVWVPPFPGADFTILSHRNADRTRHIGLDLGLSAAATSALVAGDELVARVAWTSARYTFVEDSTFDGNEIPGAPRHVLQAELAWRHPAGLTVRPGLEWIPADYYVDSPNTTKNRGWASIGLRGEWESRARSISVYLEIRNLTDARFAAAVNADEVGGRYYLPADGRAIYGGVRWRLGPR